MIAQLIFYFIFYFFFFVYLFGDVIGVDAVCYNHGEDKKRHIVSLNLDLLNVLKPVLGE